MSINLKMPDKVLLKPTITVIGVGGAGGNAVNNMIAANLQGANFVVANTDAQALDHSICDRKIQLGAATTKGLGAGASPDVGKAAAEESLDEIKEYLTNSNMVFITAGMGGGTGTGAAPVVAKLAKDMGILTVGVVTKPFHFEGAHRMKTAEHGLKELQNYLDTLIVIPNQNLFRIANERTTFADAFKMADDVLHAGVRGVTDLMIMPGLINLDFADISAVMREMGKAMMGTGEASGEERSIRAAEAAISNPLLDNSSMKGAKGVLINITGGMDMTLFEVDAAANRIRDEVGETDANIIFGSTFNPDLEGIIRVSVVATGIDSDAKPKAQEQDTLTVDISALEDAVAQELEEIVMANQEAEEQLSKFDEYDLAISETEEFIEEIEVEVAPHHQQNQAAKSATAETQKTKQSFLSRFASTVWGTSPKEEEQPAPKKEKELESVSGDVYDVPAFLRKRK
ncbi:MAG: cell division protein FtsZ [Rickettsiaceae bacterium]|jgi:cell division protein FtsZ|nr:cell division protein FtsZ [Rickettsiaceae bacterium]